MKNSLATLILFSLFSIALSQREISPSNQLKITGEVETEVIYDLDHLDTFRINSIPDLTVKNQEGEIKKTATGLSGILLTDLLSPVKFKYEKPRELNTFVLEIIASDGYKVIFSWNEIYNTLIGKSIFLVTEMNGKKLREMDERILLVSASDTNIGRRFVKCVEQIHIVRL